jgi:hypothetical protein
MPKRASYVYAKGIFMPDKAVCYAVTSGFSLVAEVYQRKEIFGNTKATGATLMLKISFLQYTPA